jgi:hypothetical protein
MERTTTCAIAIGCCAAIALGMTLVATSTAVARPFSVDQDGDRAGKCFETFLSLAEATNGAESEPERSWFSQASASAARIQPFVDATADADPHFFARIAQAEMAVKKELDDLPAPSPARSRFLDALVKAATDCDRSLDAWGSRTTFSPQTVNPVDADPDAVAKSLIGATTTICVPYVVDGVAIDKLVDRAGLLKQVDVVNGVDVVRYRVDAPGRPVVTPAPTRDFGTGPDGHRVRTFTSCWMRIRGSPDLARQVVQRFRDRFALGGYETKPPHDVPLPGVLRGPHEPFYVACVLGRTIALVEISGPFDDPFTGQPIGEVDLSVESDPIVTASEGCPPSPPAE